MLAFMSTFSYKSIWRIRHTEETHRVFEVGSEQLHFSYRKGAAHQLKTVRAQLLFCFMIDQISLFTLLLSTISLSRYRTP